MHVQEVIRRWQGRKSQRAIAAAIGVARVTVKRYITQAERLGLSQTGPSPTDEQLIELVRLGQRGLADGNSRHAFRADRLERAGIQYGRSAVIELYRFARSQQVAHGDQRPAESKPSVAVAKSPDPNVGFQYLVSV